MFTGLIEDIGLIHSRKVSSNSVYLEIRSPRLISEVDVNDSISLNGVCQTIIARSNDRFEVCAVEETLRKTTLGNLKEGERVNLELPLKLQERLDGHIVLGHVDTIVPITQFVREGESWMLSIKIPANSLKYVIPVGSIALDGVSLTVARLESEIATIAIIPHTYQNTIVQDYKVGTSINVEFDVIGKYIERFMPVTSPLPRGIRFSEHDLKELGY